jgi:integrase
MLQLPNGCKCSEPSVFPKNWKTVSASVKSGWRIQYYFYDHDKSKLIVVKRMNRYKTIEERRAITKVILQNELKNLQEGFNPLTGISQVFEIDPQTPFMRAIKYAAGKLKLSSQSLACINSALTYIEKSSDSLGFSQIAVCRISRKHIIPILEACNLSAQSYNHYRAYLMQLFTKLVELEATENNPVDKYVKKEDVEINLRELITPQEREKIEEHFREDKYFLRFLHVFFHSGARPVELTRLTKEAVNIEKLYYKIKVRKRKKIVEEKRPIKKIVVDLWKEILNEEGEYLFGKELKPGPKPVLRDYITKKWQREVKGKLGINKDLYALKHTNLDETSAILNAEAAARQAGHKSTVITLKHYLVNEEERQRQKLSEVRNKFA